MIKQSALKKLIECIVKRSINEIDFSLTTAGDSSVSPVSPAKSRRDTESDISPIEQEKLKRLQKQNARNDLKIQKKEYDQAKAKEKSLEKDYRVTRRITVPTMKKSLDAKRLEVTKM